MKNVSEQIADWLADQGVTENFTVTGGGAMFLNQAFGSHPRIRSTYMHHEQACTMAAEGYARTVGKPAVAVLTTGPGAINGLNGVFGAYTDSVPMIVISGQVKRETCLGFQQLPGLRQLGDQEGPTTELAKALCKFAHQVRSPEEIADVLPRAFAAAVSGRPGPVWLDIPLDIQSSATQIEIPPPSYPRAPEASAADIAQICARLNNAHRPLILAGTGVRIAGASRQLLDLVEQSGIPLATAWTHDLIDSAHPLFAGRPGTIGTRSGNFCLQNADFVLVIGSRLNIRQTGYNWSAFAESAWVAQVDIDPAELDKPLFRPDMGIVADAGEFITALTNAIEQQLLPDFSPWQTWCCKIKEKYSPVAEHQQAPNAPLNPYVAIAAIFNQLRQDDVVVCGNASACILPFQIGHLQAGQRMFSNSGSASMGYDLPAAIGASRSGRRIICFAGDGSLQMNIQELQTLKTLQSKLVIIVLNNAGYLSIWQTHENFFGRVIGATPASGVDFPDFVAVARAYGLTAEKIETLDAIEACLKHDGPHLLDMRVDPAQGFAPRIKSRVDETGKFISPALDDMYPFLPTEELNAIRQSAKEIRANAKG
ncbi:thiamine pyrophosphate-binding protein [Azonexus fungiphilus]|uniref:thiamine pyrophosphate-binding protein n=1 Tax=Azonexus fungiphilus TaxID=146940 RepID=UPI00156ACE54|nr:thiamine pyrophosphate-binding protein [Azonexus fungiphilus]NHC07260.1 thiamine pyrophosphate-binding protein [Azonexus fungiphilus]